MVGVLRGCLMALVAPIFSIAFGIGMAKRFGTGEGVLSGLALFVVFVVIIVKVINRGGTVTTFDCIVPTILSIIAGIAFAPIQLIEGSVFSVATCIMGGAIFSTALWLYKNGRLSSWALILPALSFFYEMLPIELPTDLDNFFSLGGAATSIIFGRIKQAAGLDVVEKVTQALEDKGSHDE